VITTTRKPAPHLAPSLQEEEEMAEQ